jgi:hypothetical protein
VSGATLGVVTGVSDTTGVVTDASGRVVASLVRPRTPDRTRAEEVAELIAQLAADPAVDPAGIRRAMVGLRRRQDAPISAEGLNGVAVLRIGAPLTRAVPPLGGWPDALRAAVWAGAAVVRGGMAMSGRPARALDAEAVRRFCAAAPKPAPAFAITGVFAVGSPSQEIEAEALVRRELGSEVHVSLSHQLGGPGLLERENATVLDAALSRAFQRFQAAVDEALAGGAIDADVYYGRHDGTLVARELAARHPVVLLGTGTAHSQLGAGRLSGVPDALVVEVTPATTEIGLLVGGLPVERATATRLSGVPVGFRLPDVRIVPLGGGSALESSDGGAPGRGPDQRSDALSSGGAVATLTDAAVAARRAPAGTHPVAATAALTAALARYDGLLADVAGRMTARLPAPPPVVAIGEGAALVPDGLPGTEGTFRPPQAGLATAVGLTTASVGGHAERLAANRPGERERAMREARGAALESAVYAGADPGTVEVVEADEIPLTRLVDPVVRVRVRVLGAPGGRGGTSPRPRRGR